MDSLQAVEGVRMRGLVVIRLQLVETEGVSTIRAQHFNTDDHAALERFWILDKGVLKPGVHEDIVGYVGFVTSHVLNTKLGTQDPLF